LQEICPVAGALCEQGAMRNAHQAG